MFLSIDQIKSHFDNSKKWEYYDVYIKQMPGYIFMNLDYQGIRMGVDMVFKMTHITEEESKEDLMCHNWIEKINGEYYKCDPHYDIEDWLKCDE